MTENDFEIDILEEETQLQEDLQLPVNFLALGQIENDDVRVYIRQDTYRALEKLASSDTTRELGSILVGSYTEHMGKCHVIISDYIEAKYTDASAATLTFTHDTWDYVHRTHAKRYPDKKIIGWQHTHPSYGIFLSNYDMFIQENFFNMPFQIAYVIDPIQNLRGFFQWKNGKVEKLRGYYVYDEVGKTIRLDAPEKAEEKPARRAPAAGIVIGLLSAAVVALSVWGVSLQVKHNILKMDYRHLQDQKVTVTQQTDPTAAALTEKLAVTEATVRQQADRIAELEGQLEEKEGETAIRFIRYTVVAGDSLSTVCISHGIDYGESKALILAVNHISDPDCIDIGQTLLLPITEQ